MTYLQFHFAFILPPLLLVIPLAVRAGRKLGNRGSIAFWLVPPLALVYTTPWDNYLVASGVWTYPQERILATIGFVPVEEYLFFILQPLLTGAFFTWTLYRWLVHREVAPRLSTLPRRSINTFDALRLSGLLVGLTLIAGGVWLLGQEAGRYIGLILVWASPVLIGMWLFMGREISNYKTPVLVGIAVPTVYLWFADWYAIRAGVWSISDRFTLGWNPMGLPVEEAVFFLMTNVLVVFGVSLFLIPGMPDHQNVQREEPS